MLYSTQLRDFLLDILENEIGACERCAIRRLDDNFEFILIVLGKEIFAYQLSNRNDRQHRQNENPNHDSAMRERPRQHSPIRAIDDSIETRVLRRILRSVSSPQQPR